MKPGELFSAGPRKTIAFLCVLRVLSEAGGEGFHMNTLLGVVIDFPVSGWTIESGTAIN